MKLISKIKTSFKSENVKKGVFFAALALAAILPESSTATVTNFEDAICDGVGYITGPLGGGIATLAIISLGIGAMLGKIAWTTVLICCAGIAAIFGGQEIVETIGGPGCP
jgi:type IV secretory pathway VirB2 component (pilin)